MDEGHRALKRYERARQLAGVRADPDLCGPLAHCRVRGGPDTPATVQVHVVALFAGGFAWVRAAREPVPEGVPGTEWMVRGGLRMEAFLRDCVRHYKAGLRVPAPMAPVRKLPADLLARFDLLPDSALLEVFAKLRQCGLLPTLPALTRETCPPGAPWEGLRARFQDFAAEATDNPPR